MAGADSLGTIVGTVNCERGSALFAVPNCTVCLAAGGDTLYVQSGPAGNFTFKNVRAGNVSLKVTHILYEPYETNLDIQSGMNMVFVKVEEASYNIKESKVTAEVPIMKQVGDTIVYNAAAVNTLDGDNAIEILKQLPGVTVNGSKIMVMGEEVKRTYVNGVLVYGNNPMSAMNSLQANEVVSMNVYDEQKKRDDIRGRRNSRKERVIDIKTKNRIVSAVDAHMLASYGADETQKTDGGMQHRYSAGATANFYSEMFLAYVSASANNINRSSHRLEDVASPGGPLTSYGEDIKVGSGIEKYFGERLYGNSIAASYNYGHGYRSDSSDSVTDYFETSESPAMHETDTVRSSSVRSSHNVGLDLHFDRTPIRSINLISRFSCMDDNGLSRNSSLKSIAGMADVYRNEKNVGDNRSWNLDNHLSWGDNESSSIVFPYLAVNFNIGRDNGGKQYLDTDPLSFYQRNMETERNGNFQSLSGNAGLEVTLKNTEALTMSLDVDYTAGYEVRSSRQTAIDSWNVEIPEINVANSFDYTWKTLSHAPGVSFSLNSRIGVSLIADFGVRITDRSDDERIPSEFKDSKRYVTFAPRLSLKYRNLSLDYFGNGNLPSIEQSRHRIDDTNPVLLLGGNPELRPEYVGDVCLVYNKMFAKGHLMARADFSHVQGAIIRRAQYFKENTILDGWDGYIARAGSTLYTYANADGAMKGALSFTYMHRIGRLKSTVRLTSVLGYERGLQYNGDVLNVSDGYRPMFSVNFDGSPVKWLRLRLNSNTEYFHSTNDLGQKLSVAWIESLSASGEFRIARYGFATVNYVWKMYRFMHDTGRDTDTHDLNAVFGWKFLKGRLGVSVSGHDLLNKGSIFSTFVDSNSSRQIWTPSYGRYFMLNISFRFNKTKSSTRFFGGALKDGRDYR